jgi:hypothetical protein
MCYDAVVDRGAFDRFGRGGKAFNAATSNQ